MLYDRWRQIARDSRHQIALTDLASGQRWTFEALATAVESGAGEESPVAFPQGSSAEFILGVLRAWRSRRIVCPLESGQARPQPIGPLPAGIVHLKTTSATTGTPRLVAFTAPQLMADADHIVEAMGLRPDWPNLGVISLAHSYGFSNLVLPLLLHGVPLTLVGATLPEALRRAAAGQPAVTLAAVPALWRTWHDASAIPTNVRLAISAGAPLPVALEQAVFAAFGVKIHNFYGSTECGGIAFDAASEPRQDGAYAGTPMPRVQLSVADDGCLEVRGEAVAQTYWPEPGPALANGVFHTSDLAEIAGGRVFLRGRASDQINVAGRKVLPETIEKILSAHPLVRECLVFGVPSPDDQRGEIVVACVAAPPELAPEALKEFAMARLPAWQVPREWWRLDQLDTNDRGKLPRAEWRIRYLEREKGK